MRNTVDVEFYTSDLVSYLGVLKDSQQGNLFGKTFDSDSVVAGVYRGLLDGHIVVGVLSFWSVISACMREYQLRSDFQKYWSNVFFIGYSYQIRSLSLLR